MNVTAGVGSPPPLAPFARTPVLVAAAAMCAVELIVSGRYGIHRDELYFIACARHLSWGYVDQPPLVPAVAWVVIALFGTSGVALGVVPALAGAGTVVVSGLTSRRLGGGRRAQTVAAVATAASTELLGAFHLLSTATFDIFFWSVISYLLVRLLASRDLRWWLPIGAMVGVALLDKLNVGYLVAAVVIAMVACRQWSALGSWWLLAGAALALGIATPDIVWNATHHWAQIAMLDSLHQENSSFGASLGFIPSQFIVVGPVLAWVWVPGARRLLRHESARPLGVAFVVLLLAYALAGAKSYYLAGIFPLVFAGGGLYVEERLEAADASKTGRPSSVGWRVAAIVAGALVALPLTLPVLPQSELARGPWEATINKDLSATVGWQQFVHQVAAVAATLPPTERARLVVYTGDYGAAGAVDLYGAAYGLPQAISGHNTFWWWGPGRAEDDSTTIAVNLPRQYLLTIFAHVRSAGVVTTPGGVWTEERGDPLWICTGQRMSWTAAWPAARHYD